MPFLQAKVKPNAKQSRLEIGEDGVATIFVKSPPVDGKANEEVARLVAETFGVPKSRVTIKSGAGSRLKLISY